MSIPDWLTKSYIEEVLKAYYKDLTLNVKECKIKPAFAKGENFGSCMNKMHVLYFLKNGQERKENYFLCKTSLEDEFCKQKIEPYDIFNREMLIYEKVLPKLHDLLKEINDTDRLFPTAFHIDYKRKALIFEDLAVQGYVMADRLERLDMDHIQLVLRKLSKMHATSVILNERKNGCLEKYDRGFFNKYTDTYKTFFVSTLMACGRYLQKRNDEVSRKYAQKLFAMEPYYMEFGKRCFVPVKGDANVFCHGDIWTNNVMFKYCAHTGKPIDALLIDFQYSFWGPPTLDLHFFFNTSIKEPLRRHCQDELFQNFHQLFTYTLRQLNYNPNQIPSLKKFMLQVEENMFYAFHSAVVIQPIALNQDSTDADFNALMGEDDRSIKFKNNLYNNPEVQENLNNLLPFFDRKGLLEVNQ